MRSVAAGKRTVDDARAAARRRDAAVREAAAHLVPASTEGRAGDTSRSGRSRIGRASRIAGGTGTRRIEAVKIGITCYPTYGGSGAMATELGIALAHRGHEIHFITYRSRSACRPSCRASSSTKWTSAATRCSSIRRTIWRSRCACTRSCSPTSLDLLHCHYAIPHATSAWIAKEMLGDAATGHQGADDAPRHRHHDRRPGSVVPRHHQVLDREIRRPHRRVPLPAARDDHRVRMHRVSHRGDPQLRRSRRSTIARGIPGRAARSATAGRCSCTSRTSARSSASWTSCASSRA